QKTLFPTYQAVITDIIPGFTAIYDQQLAGATLKVFQLASYIVALLFILIIWRQKEEEDDDSENKKNIRYARVVVVHLPNKDDRAKKSYNTLKRFRTYFIKFGIVCLTSNFFITSGSK